uniref:Uncharacterized protein n=1 Tax=Vitis vinifera TaxID=29760 RepID=F6I001_VITVI
MHSISPTENKPSFVTSLRFTPQCFSKASSISREPRIIPGQPLKATEPLTEIRQADGEEKDSAGAIYGRSGSVMQRAMSFLEDEL